MVYCSGCWAIFVYVHSRVWSSHQLTTSPPLFSPSSTILNGPAVVPISISLFHFSYSFFTIQLWWLGLSLDMCLSYATYLVLSSCRASSSDPLVLCFQFFTQLGWPLSFHPVFPQVFRAGHFCLSGISIFPYCTNFSLARGGGHRVAGVAMLILNEFYYFLRVLHYIVNISWSWGKSVSLPISVYYYYFINGLDNPFS